MPDLRAHTLIQCLTAIAQHHGLPIDPERLINDYPLSVDEPDSALLLRIAADIGLSAKTDVLSWKQLLTQQNEFPILAHLSNGKGTIVVGVRAEGAGTVAILDPLEKQTKVRWFGRQEFCRLWRGEVVFLKPRPVLSSQDKLIEAIGLQRQDRLEEAAHLFREVLSVEPKHPAALYSLAVIALNRGNPAEVLSMTAFGIPAAPEFAPLLLARGAALQALGRKEEALLSYDEALKLKPDYAEALTNSGVLLRELLRHHEAIERFNRVLAIDPTSTSALANCAILLTEFKKSEQAIAMFERLLELKPNYDYALGLLSYERLHICDWKDFERLSQEIIAGVRSGRRTCKTLALMALSDAAEDHFKAAKIFAESYCPRKSVSVWQGEHYHHDKIRIAYVSPDLREHPVGHLMAGIFEHHDKSRFETIAISLGIDDHSRLRERMLKAFDHFIDARLMGSQQIAEKMREMEVDIAIDLAGYTSDSRMDVFAYRAAPVQVGYLGYPGTSGTDYMDYIIADHQIIPEAHRAFYSEQVVYLPDTYLPTDASLVIAEQTPTRADCGLPETGFVFCSFSHDYKISPFVFSVWMRLLDQVPGSVLWLMSRDDASQRNLRHEALQRGIDPSRLVFATRVPRIEDHLARYRQADLFLDTHPYNAHTTAADALMAGLPVITYMGNAFPARVAGSLLNAIGLPEFITHSLADYEALALDLATHPERLADLKARLLANRMTHPLFDTQGFCRKFEAVLLSIASQEKDKEQSDSVKPPVNQLEQAESREATVVADTIPTRSLDLGCGQKPKNPFNAGQLFGIDVREDLEANIRRADLAIEPIPFADASFEYLSAYDFLEHIPRVIYVPERRNAFVELMNEIYRVLKDGGLFLSFTPAYPQAAAFQDPTHVNIITEQTFPLYFDNANRWAAGYGFKGAFIIRLQEWRGPHLLTVMQKVPLSAGPEKETANVLADHPVVGSMPVIDAPRSSFPTSMLTIHQAHWGEFLEDTRNRALYDSWWNTTTVNYWRHTRLLSPVFDVLGEMKSHTWLTIGDGAGSDAWRLQSAGFVSVLATDVDDTVLAQTRQRGYIKDFKIENAEALSFADEEFDFVLCKESLHHMNRPYAAIYEFLRVARYGVVLIEPQDPWVDWPCRVDATQPHYESVGNYVYQFSAREIEKIAYGMNLTGAAAKTLVDVYIPDCEFASCSDGDPIWEAMQKQIEDGEKNVAQGTMKPNYILAILFKNTVTHEVFNRLAEQHKAWVFKLTDTNPHLR